MKLFNKTKHVIDKQDLHALVCAYKYIQMIKSKSNNLGYMYVETSEVDRALCRAFGLDYYKKITRTELDNKVKEFEKEIYNNGITSK